MVSDDLVIDIVEGNYLVVVAAAKVVTHILGVTIMIILEAVIAYCK